MSKTSTGYLLRSAQRVYIRISISAKSAASTPPAPDRIVIRASRTSYSPDSRVRTSSASTALRILRRSRLGLGHACPRRSPPGRARGARSRSSSRSWRFGEPVEVALEQREPAGDARGVGLVVPQVGGGDLLAEVGDLGAHRVEVQHLLDGVHRRLELLDLGLEIWACHNSPPYATGRRLARMRRRADGYPLVSLDERSTPMPQQAWSKKRERQYEHIKEGLEERGRSEDTAEEIAARTVNKERARSGESEQASRTSTEDISSGRRGRPPVAPGLRWPHQGAALQRGEEPRASRDGRR